MRGTAWQKSSFSNTEGSCVELAATGQDAVALREGDDPDPILIAAPHRLRALLDGVKAGAYADLRSAKPAAGR